MTSVASQEVHPRIVELQTELAYEQRNLRTLLAVARAGRAVTDPQVVFHTIYAQLSQHLPVDAFTVALCVNDRPDEYRYMLFIDEGIHYEEPDTRSGGLTGYILSRQQPLFFRDLQTDRPNELPDPQRFGNLTRLSRSWMGVPLLAGHSAIGAMTVQCYQPDVYSEADFELVKSLADLASIAIDNAVLYQQQATLTQSLSERVTARQEELAVLIELAEGLSRGEVSPDLLDQALERVVWLFNSSGGAVWLPERGKLVRQAIWRPPGQLPLAAELLALDGNSLQATALHNGQLQQHQSAPGQWVCAAPLKVREQTVGVLTLWSNRPLQPEETALLIAAGGQIAVGIENSHLLQQRDRQIAQLEALSTIAQASAVMADLHSMLDAVCATLQRVVAFDGLVVALYNPGTNELLDGIFWRRGDGTLPIAPPRPPLGLAAYILRAGTPQLLQQPTADENPEWWERGCLSALGVALMGRTSSPVGLIAIQSNRPAAFDERDVQFMTNVAHQLTLNIINAQLYATARDSAAVAERRANNLTLVHSISRLVSSSLDPTEVLRIAAEQLTQLFAVEHCLVSLFSEDGNFAEVVAEYPPLGALHLRFTFPHLPPLHDLAGSGQPIMLPDLGNDERVQALGLLTARYGTQAMLLIPLSRRGRVFGSFGLGMVNRRDFTAEDFELCTTIAAQVTAALENARLHQMAVTRIEQELEIARSIQANLFPRTLPQIPGMTIAARCMPAHETGGDFYDVVPVGDEHYGFSIGDVSGKSLPAAMLMAVARSIVRSEAIDHTTPDLVMTETNRLVAQDIPANTFVALCYAMYNVNTRQLSIASAGQITPLLRRTSGAVDWLPVSSNLPLGILADLHYTASTLTLAPGDTVLFLTDGLIEAFSPSGEMFGFDRLMALFAAVGGQSPEHVVTTLLDQVCNWQGNENRHDDMTVIVARVA